jgi:hypothetical protein
LTAAIRAQRAVSPCIDAWVDSPFVDVCRLAGGQPLASVSEPSLSINPERGGSRTILLSGLEF